MPNRRRGLLWHDTGWPALAGVIAGLGVVGCATTMGPLATAGIFVAVALVTAPSTWSILSETTHTGVGRIASLTGYIALGVVMAAGWISVADGWGLIPLVVAGATSPWVLDLATSRSRSASRATRARQEAFETRRAFDEIIRNSYSSQE
jgi:hypothetical protein